MMWYCIFSGPVHRVLESVPCFWVTGILKAIVGVSGGSRQRPQARSAQIDDGQGCSHWHGVAVDAAGLLNWFVSNRPA